MFCGEIRIKQGLSYILSIEDSLQQQIHFNGNILENKLRRCNEGSLYLQTITKTRLFKYIRNFTNKIGKFSDKNFDNFLCFLKT